MTVLQNFNVNSKGADASAPSRRLRPTRPPLVAYLAALETYQQQRTAKGTAALFQSYRRWIETFLDDEGEADRAANNFLIALRNQPPESREAA